MQQDRNGLPPAEWCATPNAMRLNRLMRMSRRDALMGGLGLSVAGLFSSAQAQTAQTAAQSGEVGRFMAVSERLTDRTTLDSRIGTALYVGIVHANPDRQAKIQALATLLENSKPTSAADFARAAEHEDPSLKEVIHDILAGWYRGVADGKVVVYRSALMFDITKDAVYPKTYATGGPFYWVSKPPEVARPTGKPALTPSPFVIEPT
ncbi:MAG: sorbitol dehydrogenase family protein [Acetobacter orientalis]|uniref:sorbitol dehydrogenase family protein n=1 Tax=Acetobacter orientalis TaxID=146474 RepID=UPI0039E7E63C